jgi:hypothetical protein
MATTSLPPSKPAEKTIPSSQPTRITPSLPQAPLPPMPTEDAYFTQERVKVILKYLSTQFSTDHPLSEKRFKPVLKTLLNRKLTFEEILYQCILTHHETVLILSYMTELNLLNFTLNSYGKNVYYLV